MSHYSVIAALAILLGGTIATQAASPITCTFHGGAPGAADSEGNTGPFQPNGNEYVAEAATVRDAATAARASCKAGEELGSQGCQLIACVNPDAAPADGTAPKS
ncbi:hypothetical protein [Pseudooceanicola sp.]|uniref:hypothetical protein n=1 Tax=Pseudooceanicola sp. TaxID=1914328 RepID=UPI002636508D|nr:hypothetical protein [Pseudooceanicola sp.]MDF1855182.1 hypothetical protein [Pseudooceanicola sp.]